MAIHRASILVCVLAACGGDGGPACDDPKYGDGTCDLDTSCGMSDIDCFTTFETQAEAQAYAVEVEALLPANPRPLVPTTDPRFVRLRRLLDEAWVAYRDTYDVGDMADHTPQLVVFEDPSLNAFLPSDIHKEFKAAAFVVVANSGLDALLASDDQVIGILAHELEHALALHVIPEMKQRFLRYYVAPGTDEPFGFEQPDQAAVRDSVENWTAVAADIGYFTDVELGGWPPLGTSTIRTAFMALVGDRITANPVACSASVTQFTTAETMIMTAYKGIDDALAVEGTNAKAVLDAALIKLRDECMAGFQPDFIQILAGVLKRDPVMFRASLSAEDRALMEGKHALDGAYAFVIDRRRKMRAIQSAFTTTTGQAWTRARYFSIEEAADDASVAVMRTAGIKPDAIGDALPVLYGAGSATEKDCRDLLAAGTRPPYGENLADDHHGSCWRSRHVQDFAASGKEAMRVAPPAMREPARSPLRPDEAVILPYPRHTPGAPIDPKGGRRYAW